MINMPKRTRLGRYKNAENMYRRNRLDMVVKKRAMVKDIMTLAGEPKLAQLEVEVCALGENLEDNLLSLHPTLLADIHKRVIDFDAKPENLPTDDDMI